MRALPMAVFMLVAVICGASAKDIIVVRPGIMCSSPQALATLTLPSGDSRTHRDTAIKRYLDIARLGDCHDLQLGRKISVVKEFRNTVIVSLEDQAAGHGLTNLTAPMIDFDPAPTLPTSEVAAVPQDRAGETTPPPRPTSDAIMDVPIGMRRTDFIRIHGSGRCVDSADGGEECTYPGTNETDCPAEFSCYATVYEFLRGNLVAFHTQLVSESDWMQLYRLTLATFGSPAATTEPWGVSTSFDTKTGVLNFTRKTGPPPSWHVTLSYRPDAGSTPN